MQVMPRSDLDLLVGDDIRAGHPHACPVCGALVRWVGVPEFTEHELACVAIELGKRTVDKKPLGYKWA